MNPTVSQSQRTEILVEAAKALAQAGRDRFLKTFAAVPDDKLNFAAGQTAKTPLQIAAHLAVSNYGISRIIRQEPIPDISMEQLIAAMQAEEAKLTSRDQVVAAIEESTEVALSAMDTVDDARIDEDVKSNFGTMPMTFWINLIGLHMYNHASQIDFIQTCYGDMDFHF